MKTAAAAAHSPRQPFLVEEIDLPGLHHTDVLVRIVAVGVCHTDITSRDGQLPAPFPAAGADTLIGMAVAGLPRRGIMGLVAVPPSPERKLTLPWASLLLQGQGVRGFMEGNSIPDIFIRE